MNKYRRQLDLLDRRYGWQVSVGHHNNLKGDTRPTFIVAKLRNEWINGLCRNFEPVVHDVGKTF